MAAVVSIERWTSDMIRQTKTREGEREGKKEKLQ